MAPGGCGWERRAQTRLPLITSVRAPLSSSTWNLYVCLNDNVILHGHSLRGTDLTQFIRMRLKDAQCLMGKHLSAKPIHF